MSVYIEFYEKLAVINETEQTNEVRKDLSRVFFRRSFIMSANI